MFKPTKRKGFSFLRSYFDALNEIPTEKDKLDFLLSIINKQFLDEDPKDLDLIAKLSYQGQRHAIEKSVKGYKDKTKMDLLGNPIKDPTQGGSQGGYEHPWQQEKEKEKEKEKEEEQEKEESSIDENKFSPEIRNLSELLFSLMLKNNDNAKQPNFNSWDEHIEKLHRIDNYKLNQIKYVIEWCQQDSFWKSNILSTKKLRDKFGALVVKIKSEKEKKQKDKTQQSTSTLKQTPIEK